MAFNRQKKEQEALRYVSRGQLDKAIAAYAAILRQDSRDRRVRQRLADLYLKSGRLREARKHLVEVAQLNVQDGSHRAAVAVYKQILRLDPQDAEAEGALAEAYLGAGFPTDARKHFEHAINSSAVRNPVLAAGLVGRLIEIGPADLPLRLRQAELLVAGNRFDEAFAVYRGMVDDMRRRGRLDEVGRIAAMAIKLRPDEPDLMLDAAEAALAEGALDLALRYLQQAYSAAPEEPRTLDLLAQAFERGTEPERARPVLRALAKGLAERGDHDGRVRALERAVAAGPPDDELERELLRARQAARVASLRLGDIASTRPRDEAEMRVCARAEVLLRYGFAERAVEELRAALAGRQDSPPFKAWLAEALVARGDHREGTLLAEDLLVDVELDERPLVEQRLAVLKGEDLTPYLGAAPPESQDGGDEPLDDDLAEGEPAGGWPVGDELVDELVDDELVEGGAPATEDLLAALAGSEEDVGDQPTDPGTGRGSSLGEPFLPAGEAPSGPPSPGDAVAGDLGAADPFSDVFKTGGTFAEVDPLDMAGDGGGLEGVLAEADRLEGLGISKAAAELLDGCEGLLAAALRARSLLASGHAAQALASLRGVLDDASDGAEGYREALFELAELFSRTGRYRAALRSFGELEDLDPGFRAAEVAERVEAIRQVVASARPGS